MWWALILIGLVVVLGLAAALAGTLRTARSPRMDPFAVGEPWRRFVQSAIRSSSRLHETIEQADPGPLRDRMTAVAARLDHGMEETWAIARRGHQIDETIRRLDPTTLRSNAASLEERTTGGAAKDVIGADDDVGAALESVNNQLESVRRLELESKKTADRLRLTQTRLDELVSRAAEVVIGAGDTDAYEHDVDDLVIELEALRLAVGETNRQ